MLLITSVRRVNGRYVVTAREACNPLERCDDLVYLQPVTRPSADPDIGVCFAGEWTFSVWVLPLPFRPKEDP